jgi:hypothetical protein
MVNDTVQNIRNEPVKKNAGQEDDIPLLTHTLSPDTRKCK